MYYTVYKITNDLNGKIYIGCHKTNDLNDNYMGSGTYLKRAQEKHGIENFTKEYISVFNNEDDMFEMESILVNEEFVNRNDTYNLKEGGSSGFDYVNKNNLHFKYFNSAAERNATISPFLNKEKYSQEFFEECQMKAKVGLSEYLSRVDLSAIRKEEYATGKRTPGFLGKTHSQEAKEAIGINSSIRQSGEKNSQFGTRWAWIVKEFNKPLKIPLSDLDQYLNDGWSRGIKLKTH